MNDILQWVVYTTLGCIGFYLLGLVTWLFYLAVMHLKLVRDNLHPFAEFNGRILLVVGLILDVLTNLIIGSVLFIEIPREILFTSRVIRHKKGKGWKKKLATWFCEHLLNQFDNGRHC